MDTPVTIAIARTGTFTDCRGAVHTFTTGDLDAMASNYAAQTEPAPLVFGHPQDSHPAYGWVKRLFRNGEKLFAQIAQVPGKRARCRAKRALQIRFHEPAPRRPGFAPCGPSGGRAPGHTGIGTSGNEHW